MRRLRAPLTFLGPVYSLQFPFTLIHPAKLRPLFLAKGITLPIVAIGMMGWSIHAAGDQASTVLRASSTLKGVPFFFSFFTAVTACMGTWSTMACNIGDFSRYSKKESSAWMQMLFVPALWCITSLFGAIASNMTLEIYGEIRESPPSRRCYISADLTSALLNPLQCGNPSTLSTSGRGPRVVVPQLSSALSPGLSVTYAAPCKSRELSALTLPFACRQCRHQHHRQLHL